MDNHSPALADALKGHRNFYMLEVDRSRTGSNRYYAVMVASRKDGKIVDVTRELTGRIGPRVRFDYERAGFFMKSAAQSSKEDKARDAALDGQRMAEAIRDAYEVDASVEVLR